MTSSRVVEGVRDVVMNCWEVLLALLMPVGVVDTIELLLNSIEVERLN